MILLRAYDLEPFDLPYFTCFLYSPSSANFAFALYSLNVYNIHDIFSSEGRNSLFCSFLLMAEDTGSGTEASSLPASGLTFDELYDLFATDVLRVSYYYLGDRQRAEDVTQDVFVRYLQNRPVLLAGREKSWLLKVALNRCRDLWRSAWLKKIVLGHPAFELFPADDDIGHAADSIALAEAVSTLPAEFKEVVLLHYYQGFGVAEIADILNIAEGTVSSRLSRARSKLQKELKGE